MSETAATVPHSSMSLTEILSAVEEIARNGEGADRFRAIKMLVGMKSAGVVLPAPLNDREMQERAARILRSMGVTQAQLALAKAFPIRAGKLPGLIADLSLSNAPPELIAQAQKIDSIKKLNKAFPEIKRNGYPLGYPVSRSIAIQQNWLRDKALHLLLDREHQIAEAALEQHRLAVSEAPIDDDPET